MYKACRCLAGFFIAILDKGKILLKGSEPNELTMLKRHYCSHWWKFPWTPAFTL